MAYPSSFFTTTDRAVINGPAGKAFFGYGGGMNGGLVKISLGE